MYENLTAFPYIRKTALSFVISLCVSVWNISATTGQIFMKLCICLIFGSL